jgi:hypothetical protein
MIFIFMEFFYFFYHFAFYFFSLTSTDASKYCRFVRDEGGIPLLEAVVESNSGASAELRHLV